MSCQTEAVAEAHPVLGGPNPQTHLRAKPCPVPPTTTLYSFTVLATRPIMGGGGSWGERTVPASFSPAFVWPG